jgi:hypothetical protein
MADPRRRPGTTVNGNLAYDLDALVRERNLEEAGKVHEYERPTQRRSQPRRQAQAQPRTKASPILVGGVVILAAMVMALIMGYVQLTTISGSVAQLKSELAVLNDENVSLLTRYEQTFDLATIKETAEAAGMSKPNGAQIEYVDLSGSDVAVVYQAGGGLLDDFFHEVGDGLASLVEYFR